MPFLRRRIVQVNPVTKCPQILPAYNDPAFAIRPTSGLVEVLMQQAAVKRVGFPTAPSSDTATTDPLFGIRLRPNNQDDPNLSHLELGRLRIFTSGRGENFFQLRPSSSE